MNRKNVGLRKHLYPEPRVELGHWLAERRLATAMMDVSDGLSSDLRRLCTASGVGAVIDPDRLPLPRGVQQQTARQLALHGGDDYELLFAVSPRNAAQVPARYRGLPLTLIGEIAKGQGVQVLGQDGKLKPLRADGWDPFR